MFAVATMCTVVTAWSAEPRWHVPLTDALFAFAAVGFSGVGAVVASRRPRHPLAWVFVGIGTCGSVHLAGRSYAEYGASRRPDEPPGVAVAAWASGWMLFAAVALLLVFLPLLFPSGTLPSRRWRPVLAVAGASFVVGTAGRALQPGRLPDQDLPFDNPVGITGAETLLDVTVAVSSAGVVALVPVAVVAVALRFRKADPEQRQQIKWLLYPLGVLGVVVIADDIVLNGLVGRGDSPASGVVEGLVLIAVPVGAGIAVLRHRLLDIDVVIRRSVVFAALIAAVSLVYALVVSAMAQLLPQERGLGLFVATAVVAVLFAPLRDRVDAVVTGVFYGERRNAYGAVTRLGRELDVVAEPAELLALLVDTLAQTLKLSYAAVEVDAPEDVGVLAAEVGTAQGELITVPLRFRGLPIGRLRLAARSRADRFSASDRVVIDDLARLTAAAAHSLVLARELQRSRRRLVVAREEERARLRRDLHDGLGPTLAGVALQLGALGADPPTASADERLASIRAEIGQAIGEVRRLVEGLRPPALDETGLVGAVERHAALLRTEVSDPGSSTGVDVAVQIAGDVDALPPAVEVAAYRIVTEALTNVVRHAGASTCTVRLWVDEDLHLEVTDDGCGLADHHTPGVGLASMHERASEVGGELWVEACADAGTRVRARLPLEHR